MASDDECSGQPTLSPDRGSFIPLGFLPAGFNPHPIFNDQSARVFLCISVIMYYIVRPLPEASVFFLARNLQSHKSNKTHIGMKLLCVCDVFTWKAVASVLEFEILRDDDDDAR